MSILNLNRTFEEICGVWGLNSLIAERKKILAAPYKVEIDLVI